MADKWSKEKRSLVMSQIRSINTAPELIVRKYLFSKGFRYRLHVKALPGSPDIYLPKYNSVIFVNGCFWHGHNRCANYVIPKTNKKFWVEKIQSNIERDKKNHLKLRKMGFKVYVIWACRLSRKFRERTLENLAMNLLKTLA